MISTYYEKLISIRDELDSVRSKMFVDFGTYFTQGDPINDIDELLFAAQSKIGEAAELVEYEEDAPIPRVARIIECVKRKTRLTDRHICSLLDFTPIELRDVVSGEKGMDVTKLNVLKAFISLGADLSESTNEDLKRILPIARIVDNSQTMDKIEI